MNECLSQQKNIDKLFSSVDDFVDEKCSPPSYRPAAPIPQSPSRWRSEPNVNTPQEG